VLGTEYIECGRLIGGAAELYVMLMECQPSTVAGGADLKNHHITEYCRSYISSDSAPQFALLIKGKWGCGKTYLVDTLLGRLITEQRIENSEIAKVSLYGATSVEDLNERMFQSLHPVLSSPYVQFAGMLIRSAIKMGTSIDINADGKSDASITFGGIEKRKKYRLKDIKKRLLIVDDLERCDLDPIIIFGFFSDVIINQKLKAIFIGNEDEIAKGDEKSRTSYKLGKEKVIGLEFTVKAELEEAIKHFASELFRSSPRDNRRDSVVCSCSPRLRELEERPPMLLQPVDSAGASARGYGQRIPGRNSQNLHPALPSKEPKQDWRGGH